MTTSSLLYGDETYAVVGAAIEVHRQLGPGFLEPVYQEALEIESSTQGIPYVAQMSLPIHYKGQLLKKGYIADFVFYDKIIVEIKAISVLSSVNEAQLMNYLKATGFRVGYLFNFGSEGKLERKRLVR